MKLTTPVHINGHAQWNYSTRFVAIGSCFSEHITRRLRRLEFSIASNPNGIVFHPSPIAEILNRSLDGKKYTKEDLSSSEKGWWSYFHHGQFRQQDPMALLEEMNSKASVFNNALLHADVAILTLGTAWGYTNRVSGNVVANCHKQPSSLFQKDLTPLESMEKQWIRVLQNLKELRPNIQVLLTVSPVRHTREGMVENQRSKARLIELVHNLSEQVEGVEYFPAYEIMLDELRDYRFYERDMIHPNEVAVDIIWERFVQAHFSDKAIEMMRDIEKWILLEEHRGLHESKEEEIHRKERARHAIEAILMPWR